MGYHSSVIFHMMEIFIMFLLFSLLNTTHIFTVGALSDADGFNVHGLQELYHSVEDNVEGTQSLQIEKVSGEDENEENKISVVEKFRALLGLRSLHKRTPSNGDSENVSPSPSPSPFSEAEAPSPAPAPAPVLHIRPHSHHPHRLRSISPPRKIVREDDKGRTRKILIAVLVSAGAATLISVLGLIWGCKKYKEHKKKPTRVISVYGEKGGGTSGGSKHVGSQIPASKVSLNPGTHDLIYVDSLGIDDVEQQQQQPSCLKQTCGTLNAAPNHYTQRCALNEMEEEESNQEMVKPDFDNVSSSSTREITSVHEDNADSVKYESDCANSSTRVKVVPIDAYSSDEESFHSFGDSNSSSIRLSNASAGSLGDNTAANMSTNVSNREVCLSPSFMNSPNLSATPNQTSIPSLTAPSSSNNAKNFTTPPTPPPPPPPPIHFPPFSPSLSSTRITSKASSSSTLKNLSPPRKSDSSCASNQISEGDPSFSPLKSSIPSPTSPSIPPPPCPPPFLKATNSSAKGPPPPPLPPLTPLGKDGTPLPKLKPLHWDKVRAAPDHSMVWDKLRSSSFEFDEDMIESLFGYNLQNTMKNDEGKSKTPSPSKHVLEPKRLQNITILSKALNATTEQVCEALVQGSGLCLQQLEALAKMEPTSEEEAKLSGYKGDIKELGSVEKFVKAVLNVPFAFQRVEAMLYRETFEDEVVHLRNSFSVLEEACKELRSSRLFLKLLEAVLKTGNRMNVGTIRGGARAFKLDALLKLADVKGTDGKTTLLHFVVQEIIRAEGIRVSDSIMGRISQKNKIKTVEEKEEDYRRMGLDLVSGLSTELYNAKKTATLDLDVLASGVSNLSDGMTKLKHLINEELAMDEKSGNLVSSMKSFISYAEKSLKELQGDENRVLSHVKEITEYFHGNVSKEEANPLRIFVIVRDFLGMLDHVCKELRSSKASRSPNPLAPFR
ncbi:formin-like protein 11 isoform X1 [Rosa rugosa]|uniref:formin-like protein 11 isoform X1 n=1 Tax=Rosa rugosa TaxID=74645 RepID=UPI002B4077A9|nr:formin-like protein 11 isoform X1 [Rosa rugosa]XP_062001891.1 formin-like protein 11 isoform X1 [Rosa rugosa]